ncbi:MAG: phage portal protein [Pseudobutyrivibrio sp.]|nr:phage portal protein [Pseudobutyrivibrio sp.]
MAKFTDRLAHAWNVFRSDTDTFSNSYPAIGSGSSYRPDKYVVTPGLERTIVNAIITRIAIDCSQIPMFEAKLDDNRNFKEKMKTGLTECLTVEANIDQTGRAFMLDLIISLLDEGVIAVVPVDTTIDPRKSDSYQISSLRVGRILDWYPEHVRVRLYNDKTGLKEQVLLPKKMVTICENPLYSVMNLPNSTLKRLVRKLNLLDYIDDQTGSGKLDMIIQLPYVIKSESRRREAERRRKDIENQLANSKYGVAYTDGTEKITQLNRPLENNLQSQINDLTSMLYSQLGLTEEVFKGTADEKTMLNYYNHTIEPILGAVSDEFTRKFLTKTARTQKKAVIFVRNPFSLVPVDNIAEIADKFTRNEILTSNEIRSIIGYAPSDQPTADQLRNKNLNAPGDQAEQIYGNGSEGSDDYEDEEYYDENY